MSKPVPKFVVVTYNYDGSPGTASIVHGFEGAWMATAQARQTQGGTGHANWQIYVVKDGELSLFLDQDGPA